jgi:hypothetical protein
MQNQDSKTPWGKLRDDLESKGFVRSTSGIAQLFRAMLKSKGMTVAYRETKARLVADRRYKDGIVRAAKHQAENRPMARARAKRSRDKAVGDETLLEKRRQKGRRNQARATAREKQRRATDPAFRLIKNARSRLYDYLKKQNVKKTEKTLTLMGCTRSQHLAHVTKQLDGRDPRQCHSDHIFPFRFFDVHTQLDKVSNFTNIQPLTPSENDTKKDKLPTKAMAAKVDPACWPDGITEDMLPDIYPGWATPLRMHASGSDGAGCSTDAM